MLARVIYGFRISGVVRPDPDDLEFHHRCDCRCAAGRFYGGWVDLAGQRFLEIWSGLPVLYNSNLPLGFVQPNFWWLLGIMLLFSWMSLVDIIADWSPGVAIWVRSGRPCPGHAGHGHHVPAHFACGRP